MTNGDVIRSMTNEQLANFMAYEAMRLAKSVFDYFGFGVENQIVYLSRLTWLNQEIENRIPLSADKRFGVTIRGGEKNNRRAKRSV